MIFESRIASLIEESIRIHEKLLTDKDLLKDVNGIASASIETLSSGHRIFFAGNGGSYADAIHLAAEFVCRFQLNRDALPAIALGANGSIYSAVSNDYDFTEVYARELSALAQPGDCLIALSTSGNSPNIIQLVKKAVEIGVIVYGLSGESGGKMKNLCPCVCVPSPVTARVQEIHILLGHAICEMVENTLFQKKQF